MDADDLYFEDGTIFNSLEYYNEKLIEKDEVIIFSPDSNNEHNGFNLCLVPSAE
eukprot:Awhi_evm1s7050